jgi:copper transport protein
VPRDLPEGAYVASYRVVSLDSHPIGGSIVFSIGSSFGQAVPPVASGGDIGWRTAMLTVRVIFYAGIFGGAGGVLFLLLVRREGIVGRATARLASAFAACGSLAALLAIGIHGGELLGASAHALAGTTAWRSGLTANFGQTAIAAALGLALVALGLRLRPSSVSRALASLGSAAALASFALSGHVVTAGPRWLTVPALILHTTAIAFWTGGLVPLRRALTLLRVEAAPILRRFSRIALLAVPVLILAGLTIAILQVRTFGSLVTTLYGWLLLAKLCAVTALLGLAALNRLRLTPALARGDRRAVDRLRRTIAVEIALVLAILIATAALGTTPPPRVFEPAGDSGLHEPHEQHRGGLAVSAANSAGRAEIALASAESGDNAVDIRLTDTAGAPLEAREVIVVAANPSAGVEPIEREAEAIGAGAWRVENLTLVPAGEWSIRVEALVNDFEKPVFEAALELR